MSYRCDGGPAFPPAATSTNTEVDQAGMSLRDYFAGQAISAIISFGSYSDDQIARRAYEIANAMIAVGGKQP